MVKKAQCHSLLEEDLEKVWNFSLLSQLLGDCLPLMCFLWSCMVSFQFLLSFILPPAVATRFEFLGCDSKVQSLNMIQKLALSLQWPNSERSIMGHFCAPLLYRRMAYTQILFIRTAELRFSVFRNSNKLAGVFHWLENPSTAGLLPLTTEDPACWKQVSSGR